MWTSEVVQRPAGSRIDQTATPLLPDVSLPGILLFGNILGASTAWWSNAHGGSPVRVAAVWVTTFLLVALGQEGPQRLLGSGRLDNRAVLRVAFALAQFGVLLSLLDFGFIFPMAGVVVAAVHISRSGSWLWRPAFRLTFAGAVLIQGLAAAGVVGSTLPLGESLAVATTALIMAAAGIGNLGLATASKERALKEVAKSEERFRMLVQSSSDAVTMLDSHQTFLYASAACSDVLGLKAGDLIGIEFETLFLPGERSDVRGRLDAAMRERNETVLRWEARGDEAAGRPRWLEVSMRCLGRDAGGAVLVNLRNVTERQQAHEQLTAAATRDNLTGLRNRAEFVRLGSAMTRLAAENSPVALLFCDLDGFKPINDVHGHAAGDEVLRVVAARLIEGTRPVDVVARFGGDEFAVIMPGPLTPGHAERAAHRLRAAVRAPMTLPSGAMITVGISIGTLMIRNPAGDLESILPEADALMYSDKESSRQRRINWGGTTGSGTAPA